MELLISVLMLSIAATSDSFAIGMGFGIKDVGISLFSNLYISFICFAGTAFAMLGGRYLGRVLPVWLAQNFGAAVLIVLGLWMLYGAFRHKEGSLHGICTDPDCVDKDKSQNIELCESISIGLVLALNNMGLGIGAGISNLPILLTSILCSVTSFIFVRGGFWLGKKLASSCLSRKLEISSAFLVILLGIHSLIFC